MNIPRIDPTGRRLFTHDAPPTVATSGGWNSGCLNTQPVFQAPPTPQPCDNPGSVPLTPLPLPPKGVVVDTEALQLSPSRVVAPVGTEVVLVAGLNRKKHLHESGRPINYMLSRESVGHFTDVGKQSTFAFVTGAKSGIESPDFAVSRTLTHDKTIDRGTEIPGDDIRVLRGQSWVSVSSASPGTTRVTALAPKIENWPARQQSATIYWVDAQWQFPQPTMVRAGEPATLTTTILRQTTRSPVPGWKVRYELIDGPPAGFIVNGRVADATAVEVTSDENGFASTQVAMTSPTSGTAQVRVTVIQPNLDLQSNAENLVLGVGQTSVSWTAPQLSVNLQAPSVAEYGAQVEYNIQVANQGDVAAQNVQISSALPAQLALVSSEPEGQQMGNRVEWNIGEIEARGFRQIRVIARVRRSGTIESCVTATADGGLRSESCARTEVQVEALSLRMNGPRSAIVGEDVTYEITIRNTGDSRLTGLRMQDEFDAGLEHEGGPSPITQSLGDLEVGETREVGLTFRAAQNGQQCHRLTVTADGVAGVSRSDCVQVNPPAPDPTFTIEHTSPRRRRVGENILFRVRITNNGPAPLTQMRVEETIDPALRPVSATDNARQEGNKLIWVFPEMLPGQATILECLCQADAPISEACNRVVVTTAEGITRESETCVEVVPPDTPRRERSPDIPGGGNPGGSNPEAGQTPPPATGGLTATLSDLQEGVRPGDAITYILTIRNERQLPDENIQVSLGLTEGLRFMRFSGTMDPRFSASPDGRTVSVAPIRFVRPGETITLEIETQATLAGTQTLRTEITSDSVTQPVTADETTTVY
ncbi:MAG: hypothetical protein WDZ51_05620 [Pirellulaceae bacterium]